MNSSPFKPIHAALLAATMLSAPMILTPLHTASAQFGIGVSITVAPPELPVYEQPPLPEPGYIWTPGYWAYGDEGYFWVPGTWVEPPSVGLLWTPGYWGWNNGVYAFNDGYWGSEVGYYGGINYGFGYGGFGYEGGEWRNGVFAYNGRVNNFGGVHVTNVYERNVTVVNNNHFAFNGPGGVTVRPTPQQEAFMHANHVHATEMQVQHRQMAAQNKELLASVNHGHPAIAATARPTAFSGPGVVPAAGHAVARGSVMHEAPGEHPAEPHAGFGEARPGETTAHPGMAPAPHHVTAGAHSNPAPAAHPGYGMTHPTHVVPHTVPHAVPEHRPESAMAPHPEMAPHEEARPAPRPEMAPHAAMAPRPAPRPAMAPHPAAPPHPAPAGAPKKPE